MNRYTGNAKIYRTKRLTENNSYGTSCFSQANAFRHTHTHTECGGNYFTSQPNLLHETVPEPFFSGPEQSEDDPVSRYGYAGCWSAFFSVTYSPGAHRSFIKKQSRTISSSNVSLHLPPPSHTKTFVSDAWSGVPGVIKLNVKLSASLLVVLPN